MIIVIIYLEEMYKKTLYFLSQSDICSRTMDNSSSTSGSVEELKAESNLIIYIIGLILLIIWKITVMCQVRLHLKHKRLEELVQRL